MILYIIYLLKELALRASRESITLLMNKDVLPLNKMMKVALIGPNANATNTMQGNYNVSDWCVWWIGGL